MRHVHHLFDKMRPSYAAADIETVNNVPPVNVYRSTDWANAFLPVCFGTSMAITMMSLQAPAKIPTIFYLVSLGFMLAAASFLVSKLIVLKFPAIACLLGRVGVFFMVTVFFVAMSVPLPLCFQATNCAVYVVSLLVVLVCNCL